MEVSLFLFSNVPWYVWSWFIVTLALTVIVEATPEKKRDYAITILIINMFIHSVVFCLFAIDGNKQECTLGNSIILIYIAIIELAFQFLIIINIRPFIADGIKSYKKLQKNREEEKEKYKQFLNPDILTQNADTRNLWNKIGLKKK